MDFQWQCNTFAYLKCEHASESIVLAAKSKEKQVYGISLIAKMLIRQYCTSKMVGVIVTIILSRSKNKIKMQIKNK